jgi:hypothetical protein
MQFKPEQVISNTDIMNELSKRGAYTPDIDDDLACAVESAIMWIGACQGSNFERLPLVVQNLLRETTSGRIGIYLDT